MTSGQRPGVRVRRSVSSFGYVVRLKNLPQPLPFDQTGFVTLTVAVGQSGLNKTGHISFGGLIELAFSTLASLSSGIPNQKPAYQARKMKV